MKTLNFNDNKNIFIDENEKENYISLLYHHKEKILNIVFKHINYFIQHDRNICNNKLKLIKYFDFKQLPFCIGFKCSYFMSYLIMDLYLFASEPHIMQNGEFYLEFDSLIENQKQILKVHQSELYTIIQELFGMTLDKILKKYI